MYVLAHISSLVFGTDYHIKQTVVSVMPEAALALWNSDTNAGMYIVAWLIFQGTKHCMETTGQYHGSQKQHTDGGKTARLCNTLQYCQ
jgi:hypothetical protein